MERNADRTWELWNLRALWPEAGPDDVAELREKREAILAKEREAFAGLWSGDREILAPGHGFFSDHPELQAGVALSLHQGPYKLLPELYVSAGISPVVLINETALKRMRPDFEGMAKRLGCKASIIWVPVGRGKFVMRLLKEARAGRPVIAYWDGNSGAEGFTETRNRGLPYRLPGREIRIRTGLARLVCRLGLPVHLVSTHWEEGPLPIWETDGTHRWDRRADHEQVAVRLTDWLFDKIRLRPEQWHFWSMLKESSACFARSRLGSASVPEGLRRDYQKAFLLCCDRSPQTVKLILEREVEVWPGEVLADLTGDRFYPSAGLRDEDLEPLRAGGPTLAELEERHGRAWLRFHGLRLCLLGLARLGG